MFYVEVMDRFGFDKLDLRFGVELKDLFDIINNFFFNVFSFIV